MATPEELDKGAQQIATLLDDGQSDTAVERLRSDAFQMKDQDFVSLVSSLQKYDQKGKGADVALTLEPDGSLNIGVQDPRDNSFIAKVKNNKVEVTSPTLPDQLRGMSVEQSDVRSTPDLSKAQEAVLDSFKGALKDSDPGMLKALMVAFRDRNTELEPIMQTLAGQLSEQGIAMQFSHAGAKLSGDDKIHDVGNIRIHDLNGGPVINIYGHPETSPYIRSDAVNKKWIETGADIDGIAHKSAIKFEARKNLVDGEKQDEEIQRTFRSFAEKLR